MKRVALSWAAQVAANPVARAIVALVLFAASLGGLTGIAYTDHYVNGGVAWGGSYPSVANTPPNPMGVNIFLEKEVDFGKAERTLRMVKDGGFRWVRQGFAWNDIEISAKGDYTDRRNPGKIVNAWEKYDRIVEACDRYGLEIIARLDSPPVWARIPGDDTEQFRKGPPRDYNDYGDFVKAVASRYKGKIRYFQIWNEPNLYGEWGGHPINPEEYTRLLKVAHDAIKSVNPEAVIITAALAPTAENSVANLNDVLFLEGMYRAGAAPYFDILSTMLYGLGQSPNDRRTDLKRLNFSRPILLRQVMERFGDAGKPIWISEYAWISLTPEFTGDPAKNIWGKSVDEQTQARWLVEGYRRARAEWPWMGVMSVWYFREPAPNPTEPANFFAIVRPDFTPRPAYLALQEFSKAIPPEGPRDKPLWNAWGFPVLYLFFGLLTASSAVFGAASLGRWAGAALNMPRGRHEEAARETARNGAAVVGMAFLFGLYYVTDSVPLMLVALAGWGLLAFVKPSAGLAAVAFTIPFFWFPKEIGSQRFPIAETLLLLVFGAVLARRIGDYFLPRVSTLPYRLGGLVATRRGVQTIRGLGTYFSQPSRNGSAKNVALQPALAKPAPDTTPLPLLRENPAPAQAAVRPVVVRLGAALYPAPPAEQVQTAATPNGRNGHKGLSQRPKVQGPRSNVQALVSRFMTWNRQDAFAAPAVALLIVGTLSLFTLADPAFARDSARAYRWVIVEPVLFYFLLTDAISGRRGLLRVADFFVAAGVGVALLAIWQFLGDTNTLIVEEVSRVKAVYTHPNNLALYLGRVLPFVLCLAMFLPWGQRRLIYIAASLPLAVGFLLTYSRGAWVAVAAAMLVAILAGLRWRPQPSARSEVRKWWLVSDIQPRISRAKMRLKRRRRLLLLGGAAAGLVALALAAAIVLPNLPERVFAIRSGTLRLELWQASLKMGADHPIFGLGLDQFYNQFQSRDAQGNLVYMPPAIAAGEFYTSHPHNILLDYWLNLGIIGVLVLVWLMWRYFQEAIGVVRQAASRLGADPVSRAIALGLLASMSGFLVHGLVDNSYFLMDLALIFWMSCGLLQLLRRET